MVEEQLFLAKDLASGIVSLRQVWVIGIHQGPFGFWPILKEAGWGGCQEYGPVLCGFGPGTCLSAFASLLVE